MNLNENLDKIYDLRGNEEFFLPKDSEITLKIATMYILPIIQLEISIVAGESQFSLEAFLNPITKKLFYECDLHNTEKYFEKINICPDCLTRICSGPECSEVCSVSGKRYCANCIDYCSECGRCFAKDRLITCNYSDCHAKICADHSYVCKRCKQSYCKAHITQKRDPRWLFLRKVQVCKACLEK